LLGIEPIGIHDNFFELGGNSLLATQLILQLRDAFQVELPMRGLLETPTVARFAQVLDVACRHGSAETLPATAAIDLSAEASLDPAIRPETAFIDPVPEPAHIFLTGATGFLGASLLHELLQQTQADIHCLVRAADVEEGQKRIQRNLASYSLWDGRLSPRIIPVIGELAQPLLGLSSEQFRRLAGKLDVIYHNGALVNFIYPYHELKATNVLGTQEILRLAGQVKVKPVHYVSSIAVFDSAAYARAEMVREEDPLPDAEGFYTGYAQTKWVADRLTMEARSRAIPVCIYRPGNVAGNSQTGICNTTDYLFRMIKGCIQLGIAPADEMLVDITPVDYVSKALVYLSRQKESLGKVFHLVNPYPGYWSNLLDWIVSAGYPLQRIPYLQWRAKLLNLVEGSQDNALYPLVAFLPEEQAASPEVPSQSRMLRYDCRNTLAGLAGTSITCPPIDAALLSTYFAYLVRSGFLDAPPMSR
jgi:thioester reductase-like protein